MPKLSARANQMLIGVPILKHETGTDLVFKPHVFLSFGKSTITASESKKNAKTLGSCKPNAHWCANLKARDRDRPRFQTARFPEFWQKYNYSKRK